MFSAQGYNKVYFHFFEGYNKLRLHERFLEKTALSRKNKSFIFPIFVQKGS
jgi:hypothetical protein